MPHQFVPIADGSGCRCQKCSHKITGASPELCGGYMVSEPPCVGDPPSRCAVVREAATCVHSGPGNTTGESVPCLGCGGKVNQTSVWQCDVHGRCTPYGRDTGLTWCRTCPDYEKFDEQEVDTMQGVEERDGSSTRGQGSSCRCSAPGHCSWYQSITDDQSFAACQAGTPPSESDPLPCVYLGEQLPGKFEGQTRYSCRLLEHCTLQVNGRIPACSDCKKRLTIADENFVTRFIDPLRITDRKGGNTDVLRNMLAGRGAMLVCGGPSAKQLPIQRLAERGVFSMGVNNTAGWAPCASFIASDTMHKFHDGIWLDPKIMKFVPTPKLQLTMGLSLLKTELPESEWRDCEECGASGRVFSRRKNKEMDCGKCLGWGIVRFKWHDLKVPHCPNVWAFERRSWLRLDHTWFTAGSASWGVQDKGRDRSRGLEKCVMTMLLGLRVLQYLGAKRIFLVGVDFKMRPDASPGENYAHGEVKHPRQVLENNEQYRIANHWLTVLRPVFEAMGFETYNTNPLSGLRAFDHVPFDDAVEVCKEGMPPEPFNLSGWYGPRA